MKVRLVQATKDPIKFMADMASICYGHEEAKNPQKLVERLNKLGHHSVFEHVYYTFKIEGISRACLGQLTRHRHASYTVRSQRYCDESEANIIIPKAVQELGFDPEEAILNKVMEYYERMLASGIKREDARFILPQAIETDLYMSLNLRELIHMYKLRTHKSAQKEISDLLYAMVSKVTAEYPKLNILFKEEI